MSSAIERWKEKVEAHHIQSINAQRIANWTSDDSWSSLVPQFLADPFRVLDPVLDRLDLEVSPRHSVLDVGGGAGKYALPLAIRSSSVTVVEPSRGMIDAL